MVNLKEQWAQDYTKTEFENARFVLIDTNTPMNLGEPGDIRLFGERMKFYLRENDQQLLFCSSGLLELQKHLRGNNPEKARMSECGLRFVIDLYSQGRLSFYEDGGSVDRLRDEGFADPFTRNAALALFHHGNVLVITNDDDLAWDLLSQRSDKSRYHIHVAAVSQYGWLHKPKAFYKLLAYQKWCAEQENLHECRYWENGGEFDEA